MSRHLEFLAYVIGIAVLGFFYEPLKSAVGVGPWFFAGAVAYLVGSRFLGKLVRRHAERWRAE